MINLFSPHLDVDAARVYLDDILDSGKLTNVQGDGEVIDDSYVRRLSTVVSGLMGFKYGIACSSGTVAAEALITSLLGSQANPIIHMPNYNYNGLVSMIVDQAPKWDATVNLTSCNSEDYSANFEYGKYMSENSLWINSYLYGHSGHYDNHDLCIGDLSHLTGVDCSNLNLEHGFTSLYPSKNISAGEGGMILTNSYSIYTRAMDIVSAGSISGKSYNRRMSEVHAAIGLANAMGVKERIMKRALVYRDLRLVIEDRFKPPVMLDPYMFIINLSTWRFSEPDLACIVNDLNLQGVEASLKYYGRGFGPVHRQYTTVKFEGLNIEMVSPSMVNHLMGSQLAIPCHRDMTQDDIDYVGESVNQVLGKYI